MLPSNDKRVYLIFFLIFLSFRYKIETNFPFQIRKKFQLSDQMTTKNFQSDISKHISKTDFLDKRFFVLFSKWKEC